MCCIDAELYFVVYLKINTEKQTQKLNEYIIRRCLTYKAIHDEQQKQREMDQHDILKSNTKINEKNF